MTRATGVQDNIHNLLKAKGRMTASDLRKHMGEVGYAPEKVNYALARMSRRGYIKAIKEGSIRWWQVQPTKILRTRKPRATNPDSSPMPENVLRQLDVRIHKQERAISLKIEGWTVKIGFEP
jgi:DNA-binding transcriptional regulator PaaX